ncbi:glyoxalase [Arthrobacter sp. HMWF013]|uniref:glyoxalase n=1 Tax=Arthrobacter sp. HMWF013 TaxID=2056849 RepID=UPI000D3D9F12|nr:glyoxalase [Arthrobacter sp. HMWF013]PTT69571.1 glyoxalase [Arthrobacter sp. HMWF013]
MGGVVHFEVPADDEERARNFYSTVFGWDFQVLPPEMEYSLAMTTPVNDKGVPLEPGSINGGIGRLGGATVRGRMEVPGSGWNAYFRDPEGNVMGLWQNAGTPAQE